MAWRMKGIFQIFYFGLIEEIRFMSKIETYGDIYFHLSIL